jgi:serine/threonine-protein kinase HipA
MRVEVRLELGGRSFVLGRLLDASNRIYFEYDSAFLDGGLQPSPFKLPLAPGVQEGGYAEFYGLHGLFFDSLPDGWGLLLMHRRMRERGIDPQRVSVLSWLRWLGSRGMGALTYHPAEGGPEIEATPIELALLADEAEAVHQGTAAKVLPELELAGGSPGGARPKVVVAVGRNDEMIAGAAAAPDGFRHWLVKFSTPEEGRDAGPLEETYAQMARHAGLDFPPTRLFEIADGRRCFAVERFDRQRGERQHVHTLGGLLHASHRLPSLDYEDLLRATAALTRDQRQVVEAFRRMAFNVLACNRDDHVRNFAFLMDGEGQWTLTPAYDLTYSEGLRGHHTTSVRGETRQPTREQLLALARLCSLEEPQARAELKRVEQAVARFGEIARKLRVSTGVVKKVGKRLAEVKRGFG